MRFDKYQYLYPPRPENAIPLDGRGRVPDLSTFERMGYVAQVKKNGTANVIAVSPLETVPARRSLICTPRHGPKQPHKMWRPTPASSRILQQISGKGWSVFAAELMHSKTPHVKDTNYVFDVLVDDGDYLVGKTFAERQVRLREIFLPLAKGRMAEYQSHFVIDDHLWLAKTHPAGSGFRALFERLENTEDEGLVLRNPNAPLELCYRETANRGWQVKCRKEHKNFAF